MKSRRAAGRENNGDHDAVDQGMEDDRHRQPARPQPRPPQNQAIEEDEEREGLISIVKGSEEDRARPERPPRAKLRGEARPPQNQAIEEDEEREGLISIVKGSEEDRARPERP